jgi:protein phosphatase 1 regulatory subunit 3A/B/C/D/E
MKLDTFIIDWRSLFFPPSNNCVWNAKLFVVVLLRFFFFRFADLMGLDLADVKTFLDEVPRVPKSAFSDLKDAELSDLDSDSGSERTFPVQPPSGPPVRKTSLTSNSTLGPLFNQPCGNPDFFNRLRDSKILLENAHMSDSKNVKCVVRVVNLDFHKQVIARYTTDEWVTTTDVSGAYLPGSCDGFSDKFSIVIDASNIIGSAGKKVHFCLKYQCGSNEYWDSNLGKNYTFMCYGPSTVSQLPHQQPSLRSTPVPFRQHQLPPMMHQTMSQSPAMGDDPWQRYL